MRTRAIIAGLCVAVVSAATASAQTALDPRLLPAQDTSGTPPGLATGASAVLPGAGQYMLGVDRWVPFLAVEVWAWLSFLDRRRDARGLSTEYRDLAWSVARRVSIGDRRDTVFEYYEAMTHFGASGAFDADPRQLGVQPERDETTFNGDLWALARSLFFPGGVEYPPGTAPYERAMAYYIDAAVPPSFAWAWGDSNLEQQSFRELIRRSDEAYRSSTQLLGLILVNHLVSAIDALVLGRLRERGTDRRLRLGSSFENVQGETPRLVLQLSVRW